MIHYFAASALFAIAVSTDAYRLGVRHGQIGDTYGDFGVAEWAIATLFMAWLAVPGYLLRRGRYLSDARERAGAQGRASETEPR